jgi:L-aspartate oxidase
MDGLHPDADLAPRDIVSRAIADRMRETGDTNVYLDLAGVDGDPTKLFPGIAEACGRFGLNIATDAIPVRPGAHCMVGGLLASCSGQTSVPGLHAIGECASTGLHGANRMASNSLLEGLVTGSTCGTQLEPAGSTRGLSTHLIQASTASPAMAINQTDMLYALKSLMWRAVGVHRSGEGLSDAATQLDFWMDVAQRLGGSDRSGRELRNMLLVARVVTACASHRVESRGSHFRVDYPGQHQASEHVLLTPCSSTEDTIDALAIESMPLDAQVEV